MRFAPNESGSVFRRFLERLGCRYSQRLKGAEESNEVVSRTKEATLLAFGFFAGASVLEGDHAL